VSVDQPDEDDAHRESADTPEAQEDALDRGEPDAADESEAGEEPEGRLQAHAELRASAADAYRAYAIDQGCDRVREIEETVTTPAMRRIEAEDPGRALVGLEFRLKGRERLSEKATEAVEERGHSVTEAFGLVKDAIRYTFCYPEDRYCEGVLADCERIEAEGFGRFDRKNSWHEDEYKGINSRWRAPNGGQLFEVQFHTEASFKAKQETHRAYERLRALPEDEAEVRQLRAFQREVTAKVPIPPGAADIPDYRYP
jgi:hypothetical protein